MNKYTPLFIWLLVCFVFLIIKNGCSPSVPSPQPTCCIGQTEHTCEMPGMDDLPITYNIIDNNNLAHRYKEDIFSLNLPLDNPKLTQFCLLHTEWERLTAVIHADEWQYTVIRLTP